MRLLGQIALVVAVFLAVLLVLGSGFGQLEIMVWLVALAAAITFVVRRQRRRNA